MNVIIRRSTSSLNGDIDARKKGDCDDNFHFCIQLTKSAEDILIDVYGVGRSRAKELNRNFCVGTCFVHLLSLQKKVTNGTQEKQQQ